jgi:hypothetical protein
LFAVTLGPQILGHIVFNWALKYVDASIISGTILAEPVVSALLAWLVLAEKALGAQEQPGCPLSALANASSQSPSPKTADTSTSTATGGETFLQRLGQAEGLEFVQGLVETTLYRGLVAGEP